MTENRFIAKSGKFKGLKDDLVAWRDLFLKGGEALLQEFSDHMRTEHDFFAKELDGGFTIRICIVASVTHLTDTQFWHYALKGLPAKSRFFLAFNRHCPEEILETIWIGDYYRKSGVRDQSAVARPAFFNNYKKALFIYARRPDLRDVVEPYVRRLYESSLVDEGISLLSEPVFYGCHNFRKPS